MPQRFRIFISSPSDVFAERERVERVIVRLNGEFGGSLLEAIRWERSYYTAAKTFQDQIPLPSQTDLVLCIFWKRLGFELPAGYRRSDGTTPTGTEYEFEDAMQAARTRGTPDVLVYRKAAPVLLDAEQVEMEQAQFEALKAFWSRWFRSETGQFTAAYQSFETADQLETDVEAHIRQWLARHAVAAAGVTWPVETLGSPFRGLQSFDAGHAAVFFGRRRAVEHARERLVDAAGRGTPFLLVLGASGSGKSSLVRAGLVPRVAQPGAVAGVDAWRTCVMRPGEGDTPLHALARALYAPGALPELAAGDCPAPLDFAALLAAAPDAAARAVRLALTRAFAGMAEREGFGRPVEARLLLVVDQFEEGLKPDGADAFARALALLVGAGCWVVATLRSDLYGLFQRVPALLSLRDGGAQLDLLPPGPADLPDIVGGPAAAAGLRYDKRPDGTGLDEELVAAAAAPGALPLLQLALDALFEARDPATGTLTCAAYDALGGLPGVVERRAEAALAGLDDGARAALPRVLPALVDLTDEGQVVSRPAPLSRIAPMPDAARLVDTFIAARLLVPDAGSDEPGVRVAHESLLSGWPRARALLAADREMLRVRARVEAACRRWLAEGKHPDFLLAPGRPLAEAADLAGHRGDSLDADGRAFVEASQAAEAARRADAQAHAERELRLAAAAAQARADAATALVRRTRTAAAVVGALLVVAAGAAVYAQGQRTEAQRQAALARQQTAEAERNFQTALDGGAGLVAAVDAHLGDGGMTRRVARKLLGTAEAGIGRLLPQAEEASLPPPVLDAQSRLQASMSRVLTAVCDSGGARNRAVRAVAMAEAAARARETDGGEALLLAMDAEAVAAEAEGDWAGARAILERAEARGAGQGDVAQAALRTVRRDLAFTLLDGPDHARGVALLRDDLAWQEGLARPGDPAVAEAMADDRRRLAYAAQAVRDPAAQRATLDEEAAALRRATVEDPANLKWQRFLILNARGQARLLAEAGDAAGAAAKGREASAGAAALLAHDPENAQWRMVVFGADLQLALLLLRSGDEAGAKAVLRPDMEAVQALAAPGVANRMCLQEAAAMRSAIGSAMILMGSGEEGVAALEAVLALAQRMSGAAPRDAAARHGVAEAETALVDAYYLNKQYAPAAKHARAGVLILRQLLLDGGAKPDWYAELARLRQNLGLALMMLGDTTGAVAAHEESRAASEVLLGTQPQEGQWRHEMVVSLLRIAEAHARAGDNDAQWAALQRAVDAAAPLDALADGHPDWQRTLIDVQQTAGVAELVRHEPVAALTHLKQAFERADALAARYPDDLQVRMAHAQALAFLSAGYRGNGRLEEADAYAERSKAALAALTVKRGG